MLQIENVNISKGTFVNFVWAKKYLNDFFLSAKENQELKSTGMQVLYGVYCK